jgi:biotin--protein ligase
MAQVSVYVDQGVDGGSLRRLLKSLQRELAPQAHLIQRIDAAALKRGGWEKETALLVIPGGRDLYYHSALDGEGTKRIRHFVEKGGGYLGICAGAYFGSSAIEFEKGGSLEVCGKRSLGFFPGIAKGSAYGHNSYSYEDCRGAEAAHISWQDFPCHAYFNGGCFFDQPEDHEHVQVLSRYLNLKQSPAAIIRCKVGRGTAILSGVHIEYSSAQLDPTDPFIARIFPLLRSDEDKRRRLFQHILEQFGLKLDSVHF